MFICLIIIIIIVIILIVVVIVTLILIFCSNIFSLTYSLLLVTVSST